MIEEGGKLKGRTDAVDDVQQEWALRRTIAINTFAERSSFEDVQDLDLDAVTTMLSRRCSKVVGDKVIVRSEYSGMIIASFPTDVMTYKEYRIYLKKYRE